MQHSAAQLKAQTHQQAVESPHTQGVKASAQLITQSIGRKILKGQMS